MEPKPEPFYLGVGSIFSETVTSKLTTNGSHYVGKMLRSRPENWRKIVNLLGQEHLAGAVIKLTGHDYGTMRSEKYSAVAEDLLAALGGVPHLVLVHEAVAGPPLASDLDEKAEREWSEWVDTYDDGLWNDRVARAHFGDMDPDVQARVHEMLDRNGVTITTYKLNAEASILASDFIGDLQDNLIFRIYVPAGRIYEEEISRLLALFHHWLGAVKGATVRQGGYQTPNGRVIEFFGEGLSAGPGMSTELAEFNEFLGLLDDPAAASAMLVALGVDPLRVDDLVARYVRDARRVLMDARHERDHKMLQIHQQLESELAEEDLPVSAHELTKLVQRLVPAPSLALGAAALSGDRGPSVVINTQVFERVEGVVAQNLNGPVNFGTPVDDLIKLIRTSEDHNRLALEDAVKQLADPGTPSSTRISARQKVRGFLIRNAGRIEGSMYNAIWEWVTGQIGG